MTAENDKLVKDPTATSRIAAALASAKPPRIV